MLYCQYCNRRVKTGRRGARDRVAWCPYCKRVSKRPLFTIPSWIAGTLCVLLLVMQLNVV